MIRAGQAVSAKHEKIQQAILHEVIAGRWAKEQKIPSVKNLAQLHGASVLTARKAVETLMSQGILVGRKGMGIYVNSRPVLDHIGVVVGVGPEEDKTLLKPGRFLALIQDRFQTWADEHLMSANTYQYISDEQVLNPNGAFWRDVTREKLHGVIIVQTPPKQIERELSRLKIPCVAISAHPSVPYRVTWDTRALIFDAVRLSVETGRKRLGVIAGATESDRAIPELVLHKDLFAAACLEFGLPVEPRWIKAALPKTIETGYRLTLELLGQPDWPNGLIVPDDVMARGVLQALQERQVKVPQQMTLVVHANKGTPAFDFPISLTRLEFDPIEMVDRAAEMLVALMRARPLEDCVCKIEPRLIRGESC